MKKYTVIVAETMEIPAESAEDAAAETESMWENGELGDNMVNSEVTGSDLVGSYIFN